MIIAFAIIFSIVSIIISYRLKTSDEPMLILKICIYYLVSITTITINKSLPIPIGFILSFILADISSSNKKSKKIAAVLGLIDYMICVILYFII